MGTGGGPPAGHVVPGLMHVWMTVNVTAGGPGLVYVHVRVQVHAVPMTGIQPVTQLQALGIPGVVLGQTGVAGTEGNAGGRGFTVGGVFGPTFATQPPPDS